MLILSRHGQTDYGARGLVCGSADIPLNAHGHREAQMLALRLSGVPLKKIYASPLSRAKATAESVLALQRCPIEYLDVLRERRFGVFEGRHNEELQEALRRWDGPPELYRPEGGENYPDLQARLTPFVQRLKEEPTDPVLIVAHGNVNRAVLQMLLGGRVFDYPQANCCMHVLQRDRGGEFFAECINEVSHLGADAAVQDYRTSPA